VLNIYSQNFLVAITGREQVVRTDAFDPTHRPEIVYLLTNVQFFPFSSHMEHEKLPANISNVLNKTE
jgi:hypothetical protein